MFGQRDHAPDPAHPELAPTPPLPEVVRGGRGDDAVALEHAPHLLHRQPRRAFGSEPVPMLNATRISRRASSRCSSPGVMTSDVIERTRTRTGSRRTSGSRSRTAPRPARGRRRPGSRASQPREHVAELVLEVAVAAQRSSHLADLFRQPPERAVDPALRIRST
jgi:hypothetical protein